MLRLFRILLGILLIFPSQQLWAKSTKPLKHKKKIYQSKEGKLFVPSNTRIFLKLSLEDKSDQNYSLISVDKRKSLFTDSKSTEKKILYKKSKRSQIEYPFTIDSIAPKTKDSFLETISVVNGRTRIFGNPTDIKILATDALSGIDDIYYSLNNSNFTPYRSKISINDPKAKYKIRFYAVDQVGNPSLIKTRRYSLDTEAPKSKFKFAESKYHLKNILSPKAKIKLLSKDAKAGVYSIYYSLKDYPEQKYEKGKFISLKKLKEGTQKISYYATDRVGNIEKIKNYNFYLDRTAPKIKIEVKGEKFQKGNKLFVSPNSMFELSATDNKAGVKQIRYNLKGHSSKIYSKAFKLPKNKEKITLYTRTVDKVLNVSKLNETAVIVDKTPPVPKVKVEGPYSQSGKTHFIGPKSKIYFTAKDRLSGVSRIDYKLNQSDFKKFSQKIKITKEGDNTIFYTATDKVKNTSRQKTAHFNLDKNPPEIFYYFSTSPQEDTKKSNIVIPLESRVFFAASDKSSGVKSIFYSVNSQLEEEYNTPLYFSNEGSYRISVRAIDKVGNQVTKKISFKVSRNARKPMPVNPQKKVSPEKLN